MVKIIILSISFFCAAVGSACAQGKSAKTEAPKPAPKFLDDISIQPETEETTTPPKAVALPSVKKDLLAVAATNNATIEGAGGLQFKYSLLLDVEVELVRNISLYRLIDEWYGVRYLFGGTTKRGIDCSAFMQVLFASLYGISLPRTAKMQYDFSRTISRAELREGDLLFFNTRGGVSHVGMYLTNNKFVHASTRGVVISDMFDPYYAARLIGAGRILNDGPSYAVSVSTNP